MKLVRSRVRTPGRQGYGKYALVDAQGETVLGQGAAPTATAAEVERYLRSLERQEWSGSLGLKAVPKTRRKRTVVAAPPSPVVRDATSDDAEAIATLIHLLDHPSSASGVRKRLKAIAAPTLVASLADEVIGLCGTDISRHIHRDRLVGRITILVVAEAHRGIGIGRMLVAEAEKRLRRAGCGLIEITSNRRHEAAHRFYERLGYDQPSLRFAKSLRN